ncbi:MAG: universal stress protein [Gemmatimonadetes bacterium]|nr:universal stress protein [Gemmatimonadota bacterium]
MAREAQEWQADVVVVGSHGKGWWDRLVIGVEGEAGRGMR